MEKSVSPIKSRPPYLLGLLCLIPLIGAFVGIGLLLLGILQYKDKWLSIIGAAGILLTVGVYGSLFYALNHSSMFRKGYAELCQSQLNSLVKNIEFYKIQHGEYPDSLPQLLKDDKLAPIDDVSQIPGKWKTVYYNYQKIGSKYVLFSSGEDRIPNTNDDLYPQVTISDSTKIGLISPREAKELILHK